MDKKVKILILGDSLPVSLTEVQAVKNQKISSLTVSADLEQIKKKAPHIIIINSSKTDGIERVIKFIGQELFKPEPVFLVLVKEACRDECEKLLAHYGGYDLIYEPLSSKTFSRKIEFLSGLVETRAENEVLGEMVKKARFAGHEINNPLTAIIGNTEMLLEEELDGMTRKMVDIVRREGLRIAQLVEEMMEDSRPGM